jgi:hypothetical protein
MGWTLSPKALLGLNPLLFPSIWCHVGVASISHFLVLDLHLKAVGPICGSRSIGPWTFHWTLGPSSHSLRSWCKIPPLPMPHDLLMVKLCEFYHMLYNGWGTFPKCVARISYWLILYAKVKNTYPCCVDNCS